MNFVQLAHSIVGREHKLTLAPRGREDESSRNIDMTLPPFKQLHDVLVDQWDAWVDAAPQDYKVDGFLTNHVPVAVTIRYGQNQEICSQKALELHNLDAQRDVWLKDHQFTNLMEFSFALATHISYVAC